ncbi:retron Ec67 family RNA-directed DNA polymerase/endonuclease [Enterococcus faecalis]|uniref:retron Ec67 family RNA-directed DNA polymerase/endonuclease n=1 Tax=Enterococcus faecalis TaxID=1351 RepID=UPI003B5B7338
MVSYSDIQSRDDFFKLLNISKQHMTYLLYNKDKKGTENSYYTFEIEKKNGGVRVIHSPNDELKFVQKRLASVLWNKQKEIWNKKGIHPNISHAYEKNKSIITNAKIHRNKKFILNVDLEDFFSSFHFGRVKGFFEKDNNFKVPSEVALIIAQLTCYKGILPQGAPSSPIITNLICKIMDFRILKIARKYRLDYSRYADDLTFSTNRTSFLDDKEAFMKILEKEINRAGFKLNENKTRLQYNSSRQEVTGLIVNKKLSVPREYYKQTRAMAHTLYKTGEFFINNEKGTVNQLEGRFTFINQLDKWNNKLEYDTTLNNNNFEHQKFLLSLNRKGDGGVQEKLKLLNTREREYQKFLYYKYFYGNTKPTIVTEGKTDIRYLKAALKKMYQDYPNLIEKKNNKFIFKVYFLKRIGNKETSRFKYFFGLEKDGADTMKNLYNFFSDLGNEKLYPNYLKYFNTFDKHPLNPTIFIFDNEISNSKKPLGSFMNYAFKKKEKVKQSKIDCLKENLFLKIEENLYVVTNQLLQEKDEMEIEDLFDEKTLHHSINGKTFSKKGDPNLNYGKEIFSKFVLSNYEEINFENFRPILNNADCKIKLDK